MLMSEMRMRNVLCELDDLLEAFDDRYMHLIDTNTGGETKERQREREKASVLFYHIRDIAAEAADRYGVVKPQREYESKRKHDAEKDKQETVKKAEEPVQEAQPVEQKIDNSQCVNLDSYHGRATIHSEYGSVRIFNTELGVLASASDIGGIIGYKAPGKWTARNCYGQKGVDLMKGLVPTTDCRGFVRHVHMCLANAEEAEKIMEANSCTLDMKKWIRNAVYGFNFPADSRVLTEKGLELKRGRIESRNSAVFQNANVQVSWT